MKHKSKFLLSSIAAITLLVGSLYIGVNTNKAKEVSTNKPNNELSISYTGGIINDKDLIDRSDIIVKGKILKIKEQAYRTVTTDRSTGKVISVKMEKERPEKTVSSTTFGVSLPMVIYEVEITDSIKNKSDTPQIIELSMVDADTGFNRIKTGNEYVLFLRQNTVHKDLGLSDIEFGIMNPDKGIYHVKDNKNELEDMKGHTTIKYNELKAKITKGM